MNCVSYFSWCYSALLGTGLCFLGIGLFLATYWSALARMFSCVGYCDRKSEIDHRHVDSLRDACTRHSRCKQRASVGRAATATGRHWISQSPKLPCRVGVIERPISNIRTGGRMYKLRTEKRSRITSPSKRQRNECDRLNHDHDYQSLPLPSEFAPSRQSVLSSPALDTLRVGCSVRSSTGARRWCL